MIALGVHGSHRGTMPEITFHVQGSDPNPYCVTARRIGNRFRMSCTCKAGIFGTWCKHRADLLAGDLSAAIDPPADAMSVLQKLHAGTDATELALELQAAIQSLETAKKNAEIIKKRFAKLLDSKID